MTLYGARGVTIYSFVGGAVGFTPADSTNYYYALNAANVTGAPSTTAGTARNAFLGLVELPGVINSIDITVFRTVAATTETSTFYLRQCIAATDTSFSTNVTYDVATGTTFTYSNLGLSVPAGEVLQIRQLTPAWVTNPTNVITAITVYLITGGVS